VNQDETISLDGLTAPVDVYFDDYGIPHISAQNTIDLVRAVGFVQSRYRFFQLDILRRFGKGRISELVGDQKILFSSTVDFDLAMRGWAFEKRSRIDLAQIPGFDREVILAFTDGINQGLSRYRPVEYDILGIEPEAWAPSDTLVVSAVQFWSITHNWEQEAVRFSLALSLGLADAERIYPNDPLPGGTTLTAAGNNRFPLPPAIVPEIWDLFAERGEGPEASPVAAEPWAYTFGDLAGIRPAASNAWVVSGRLSSSGKPLLSNDMHLTHFLPSLIFLQHIKSPDLEVAGATLPGLPFIVGGHNGAVAWGVTSSVADVVDLLVEKPDPGRPGFVLTEAGDCALRTEPVIIRVRKGDDLEEREFKLRRTCHGPILNDMYPGLLPPGAPLIAIKWELPDLQHSIGKIYEANRAQTLAGLRDALMEIPVAQNIMAVDTRGDIGFFSTGKIPVRRHHRGTFPVPGWLAAYDWDGWTPEEMMPAGFNPGQGFLVNTNNKVVDPRTHRPVFHVDTAPSYRFARAVERIEAEGPHDRSSMQKIQLDNRVLRARQVLPHMRHDLETLEGLSDLEKEAVARLKHWDYFSDTDSIGAALFYLLYREAIVQALSGKTSPPVLHAFLKQRYSTNVVDLWFEDGSHVVWDDRSTPHREDRGQVIRNAFKKVVAKLEADAGSQVADWHWGDYHTLHPKHLFGGQRVLGFMNLEKIGLPGGLDTVWKAHFNLAEEKESFKVVAGPAFRFAIDMADIQGAGFCIDTGESGWPLSPHYGDMYEKWQKGELVPMVYDWEKIRREMTRMRLTPSPDSS
jgi:penicillin amidase